MSQTSGNVIFDTHLSSSLVSPYKRRRSFFAKSIVNSPIACPRNTKIKSRRAAWFRSQVDTHRMWQAREPGACTANQWFFLDWLSFSQPSGRTGTACGSAFALFIMQLTTRRHLPPQSCIHSQVRIDHTRATACTHIQPARMYMRVSKPMIKIIASLQQITVARVIYR